jgi:hypothetical protein
LRKKKTDNDGGEEATTDDDDDDWDITDDVNWEFIEGHPGRNFACLKKLKRIQIPLLYYNGELPDLEDCDVGETEIQEATFNARNKYATTMLLLFYPFRDVYAFGDLNDRWDFFTDAVDNNDPKLYPNASKIMQNIQNLHNSKKFVKPRDQLILDTVRIQKQHSNADDEDSTNMSVDLNPNDDDSNDALDESDLIIEEFAHFRNELENSNVNQICTNNSRQFDPKHIFEKSVFKEKTILREKHDAVMQEGTNENIESPKPPNATPKEHLIQVILDFDKPLGDVDQNKKWTFDLPDQNDKGDPKYIIDRIDACAAKYKLDVYQKAAFDIMCSSFMLTYLEKSTSSNLPNYQEAKSRLLARGADKQLIMILSGAGGCGKSHVIGAAKAMCIYFCRCINQAFDVSSFLVTASTNSAAALIGGLTIHSVAQLRTKFHNVTINGKDIKIHWVTANLIIIDEISMLSLEDFHKLDKHLRQLMREATRKEVNLPFGGLHIVLCGDFFQLNPVMAVPIYNRRKKILWHLINKVVFLKGYNHRFESDPEWGELLDRLRLGLLTEDDYDFLDSRVLGPTLRLPKQGELDDGAVISYSCPTNALRNRITENNFQEMLKHTHPSKDSEDTAPEHSVIIKGVFRGKKGMNEKSEQFHRLIYNTCGDDNIVTSMFKIDIWVSNNGF